MEPEKRAIAIVGLSAVLPDAPDAESFWRNVAEGRYSIGEVPAERWDPALYYDADPSVPDKTYSKLGAFVRDFAWEPMKWRLPIPPRVADAMDEGQKWAVACARAALADYGHPKRPLDLERTAAVIGNAMAGEKHYLTALRIHFPDYARALGEAPAFSALPGDVRRAITAELHERIAARLPENTEDTMPGELANCIAGRIANLFDLHGPNFVCDAACAAALAAIDAAVEGLVEDEYDAVLAGGVDRNMGPEPYVKFSKIGALSATGTRPYAEGADGFVMGEGAVFFLLKRLADAERDGDRVYAVLRGIGGSSDGKGKGITAPNPVGQRLAIERAWKIAGVPPSRVGLIEGHGTSTRVGDVVEVESLNAAFGGAGLALRSVPLGSVKSNIGHLKGAAGAAGLLKAVLALHEKVLPRSLHCERPNPNIDFANSPFYVNTETRPWEAPEDGVRSAGVSAFGFGGTNFHAVLEEHVPGRLGARGRSVAVASAVSPGAGGSAAAPAGSAPAAAAPAGGDKAPPRGALVLGAGTPGELATRLEETAREAHAGRAPAPVAPPAGALRAPERLVIDYANAAELAARSDRARRALEGDDARAWRALRAQGIFRGRGAPGRIAFLYTGQGSQYPNMLRELRAREPVVAETFEQADRVMQPLLGRPLSEYLFVDPGDAAAVERSAAELRRTEITQPAVLSVDVALTRLLAAHGITPDMVMGHSLGEYGALVAAGALPFEDALEAVSARGREMASLSVDDNGKMAAVMAPLEEIERAVASVGGGVVIANLNSTRQAVIGGASRAVDAAVARLRETDVEVAELPVSHAFHTSIVAPASEPLRRTLARLRLAPPAIPLVANVTGELYPMGAGAVAQMLDLLAAQVASPVQFVKGARTLFEAGARVFVEVGPKKALHGFVEDILGAHEDVSVLFTNHPKVGELPSFNHALCGLWAAGAGARGAAGVEPAAPSAAARVPAAAGAAPAAPPSPSAAAAAPPPRGAGALPAERYVELGRLFAEFLERGERIYRGGAAPADAGEPPVVTGGALGLPGTARVFDDANVQRILDGEQEIDVIPTRFRRAMVDKHITRLVKAGDTGEPHFETIEGSGEAIKLAARAGALDLEREFGVPAERLPALDVVTRLAMAAGVEALRDAGIPLVMHYRTTHKGTRIPGRFLLPESLRDDTGVIFASAFPGFDSFADELTRYHTDHARRATLDVLEALRARAAEEADGGGVLRAEIERRIHELEHELSADGYRFDRRFLFRVLPMAHAQFAEYVGARGPNTHLNSACASTTQAFALAEDWIRAGRCRRAVIIAADDATTDHLLEWMGSGFLATGAAATDEVVEEAALPFDRRRHGMILGMGAAGVVVEAPECARERGLRPICEVLSTATANSAFHGTRLDVHHICAVMEGMVARAEARFGLDRREIARELVFVSHETYTPARGGSAAAEIQALRHVFGDEADRIVVANTKGFTGHPMGVGIEDVVAIKALETGVVPPVPNLREPDPELGSLHLSRGGAYPIRYAMRLGAGFGSQISLSLLRWVPTADGTRPSADALGYQTRLAEPVRYREWLARVSGDAQPELEVSRRTLRVRDRGPASRAAAPVEVAARSVAAPGAARSVAAPLEKPAPPPASPPPASGPARADALGAPLAPTAAAPLAPTAAAPLAPTAAAPLAPTAAAPLAPTASSVEPAGGGPAGGADPVSARVLEIVADKTGYPPDMLDLDLDLEADLGIDTVKQAETFAAIREAYGIARDDSLRLRDYPTLSHAIQFVRDRRPDLAAGTAPPAAAGEAAAAAPAAPAAAPPAATPPSVAPGAAGGDGDAVQGKVLEIVADKTGYPPDMLDLDLDLEADLGIDTVKQAETFAAIREAYGIARDDSLRLRDYPTLSHAIQFVRDRRPDLVAGTAPPAAAGEAAAAAPAAPAAAPPAATPPSVAPGAAGGDDAVQGKVLEIVADKTGYPPDMLDLDLDLEADLGIDTVKQAETFAAIREAYGIARDDSLRLRDYPTLSHAIQFVRDRRPDLAAGTAPPAAAAGSGAGAAPRDAEGSDASPAAQPATVARPATAAQPAAVRAATVAGDDEAAAAVLRRVPVPVLRPPLEWCKPTGVKLGEGGRVVVLPDRAGVGRALLRRLERLGVEPLEVAGEPTRDALEEQLRAWLAAGPIQGVYWLPALDPEGDHARLDLAGWRRALGLRVKLLYTTMRVLSAGFDGSGGFLVAATRLGGLHGYDAAGAVAPMGGAVSGFAKAWKREHPEALVKVVDFPPTRRTAELADALISETERDPGAVEIGLRNGRRTGVALVEREPGDGARGLALGRDAVYAVTGAAGSIVCAITADLAARGGGTFHLLDRVPEPDPGDADLARFASDREGLKRELFERLRAAGERATPARIERELAALERSQAALAAIQAVRAAGGTPRYHQVDLTDGEAVAAVMARIREQSGRIDALLHAAGVERSHRLPDKEPGEFDLVFDVKCDGWFNLMRAAADLPLGAVVAFSSIAGRFGNAGQTDYSAANDLLCKCVSGLRSARPETRAIALDWTAWGDIGMATRGAIPEAMARAGIDMLPARAGVPIVRQTLECGGRGELLIAGRLGILLEEWDATGGIDVDALEALERGPMLGRVLGMGTQGLRVATRLSPREQPFLDDHRIDGTPVLPGVMGIEAFAELAMLLEPGRAIVAVEDVAFLAPFKLYRDEPRELELVARFEPGEGDEVVAHCRLLGRRALPGQPEPQVSTHFRARVRLGAAPPAPGDAPAVGDPPAAAVGADALYRVYFHGPAYRVLARAWREGGRVVGRMAEALPDDHRPAEAPLLASPRLVELCFQTAGAYEIGASGRMGLPQRIGRLTFYGVDAKAPVHALVTPRPGADGSDAVVVDGAGRVCARLEGYTTVPVPEAVPEAARAPLRAAMA